MTKKHTVDLVVPCYNEEEGLEHFVLETNKVIDSLPDYAFRSGDLLFSLGKNEDNDRVIAME